MGEEFYCILKLVSGEEIFALISTDDNDGDPIIILQNPITMKMVNNQGSVYVKVKPWLELSDDDIFIIKPDKVITMTETNDSHIIKLYNDYLSEDSIESPYNGSVKPSSKMGYISSVQEAREKLENIFKGLKER